MKLVRYGQPGREKPGLIDNMGKLRSLSRVIPDLTPAQLSPAALAKLRRIKPEDLPLVRGQPRMGVPIRGIGKFLGVGLNYADHAAEAGMAIPAEPIVFTKAIGCLVGPDDDVKLPRAHGKLSKKSDWEAELGIVMGTRAQAVGIQDALKFVAGYCVVNDLSEREYQLERGGTWDKGKGCDTFGPVGPWLVTTDEIANPQNLDVWLDLNGQPTQRGNTATMIFGVAHIVSYISQFMTLEPGDVITTGTPPGVGMGRKVKGVAAPRYLKRGDVMRLGLTGLGEQTQRVT